MTHLRISQAAQILGVSADTVRRWIDSGSLTATSDDSGRKVIAGATLAQFSREQAEAPPDPSRIGRSARNKFVGLVTDIKSDSVMSQVEMQCGPHRIVSLLSTEAVQELGLEVGSVSVAVIKATNVIIETPPRTS